MISYRIIVEPDAEDDVAAAFEWYEEERRGLGRAFLTELVAAYDRIRAAPPQGYQIMWAQVRHARVRRFPYAAYFVVEDDLIIVFAVLHSGRNPATWQRRRG